MNDQANAEAQTPAGSARFPGRRTLYVREAARALGMRELELVTLLDSGAVAGELVSGKVRVPGARVRPCEWRVPIATFEALFAARSQGSSRGDAGALQTE